MVSPVHKASSHITFSRSKAYLLFVVEDVFLKKVEENSSHLSAAANRSLAIVSKQACVLPV